MSRRARAAAVETPPAPRAADGRIVALPAEGDDAALVARAVRGDRWAEEAIYRRHVHYVAGLALRLSRSRADMEDVVQDAFVTAFEHLAALRDGGALRGWLAQITVSKVRRRLRRRRLLGLLGLDDGAADATLEALAAPGISGEARAELAALDRVLAALPEEQRIAWMIRHVEGAGLDEVAVACACSLATAKRRIAAAEARVRLHVTLKEVRP
jgi:RNA polymerase sigma-70 factor (ECF subfamily)